MNDELAAIFETRETERLATGFVFTEGPLWHPHGQPERPEVAQVARVKQAGLGPGRPPLRPAARSGGAAMAPAKTALLSSAANGGRKDRHLRGVALRRGGPVRERGSTPTAGTPWETTRPGLPHRGH